MQQTGNPKNKKNFYDRLWGRAVSAYKTNPRHWNLGFVLLLFILLLSARINDINIKNQLHSDEIFSLMLSTCNEFYHTPIPDGTYTGAELKTRITLDDEGGFSGAASDIARLWHNNGDAPHASLYYMLLRLTLIGFDSFDVHEYAWRGGALNLIFFALSFFFMLKLLQQIFKNNFLLVLAGLAIAFGNWMAIRNTLLIREYQMAETGIILLTLIGVRLMTDVREKRHPDWRKYIAGLSLATAFVISLGYFNAIYVAAFGIGIIITCWHHGERRALGAVVLAGVLSVAVAMMLYPGFFNFLMHDSVHKERAFRNFTNIFRYVFVRDISLQFFTTYGSLITGLLTLTVLLSKNRRQLFKTPHFAWIPVAAVGCMLLIQYASVLKMPRYYYPLMPVFALLVPHLMSAVPKSWKGYFELLICLYFPIIAALFPLRENYRWAQLKSDLQTPATVYALNPNEAVQLIPCMNDTVKYKISNADYVDISRKEATFIITTKPIGLNNDSILSLKKRLWNKNIFIYKFSYRKPNENPAD